MTRLFSLEGRTAMITGASRGLGKAIALGFAEAGASLILAARDAGKLEETAEAIRQAGGQARTIANPGQAAKDLDRRRGEQAIERIALRGVEHRVEVGDPTIPGDGHLCDVAGGALQAREE